MKKIIILLVFGILLFNMPIYAQTLQLPKNIQSPNASSLGKYGDIPMDLSSGRANVSIPVYTISERGIPLDISLNYDTGGVRVNDTPGWVGQNWSLNAGGVITRVVKGQTFDEKFSNDVPMGSSFWGVQSGYYYYIPTLNNSQWNQPGTMKTIIKNSGITNAPYPSADLEPDIFIFNFMGHVGKFFLGPDGSWKVSSKDNIKVEININDKVTPMNFPPTNNFNQRPFLKVFNKITLTDDRGNKYIFGGVQDNIEYTIPDFFNQLANPIIANAWYLSEVYDKIGTKVYSFEYERGDYIASFYNTNSFNTYSKQFDGTIFTPGVGCIGGTGMTNQITTSGQLIIPTYLKSIKTKSLTEVKFTSSINNALKYKYQSGDTALDNTFLNITSYLSSIPLPGNTENAMFYYIKRLQNGVTSNPNTTSGHFNTYLDALKWRKLDNIIIKDNNSVILKQATLTYNDVPNQRLKLEKLNIDNQFNHSFEYNNFNLLPNYTSTNVDHFGYYKSAPFSVDYNSPAAHAATRETDVSTVGYGTLSRIIFPLGGYTTFEYEPHTYSKYVNSNSQLANGNGIIGGVRIKRMEDYSDPQNKIIKDYKYIIDINSPISSGNLLQKNEYYVKNYILPTENSIPYYQTQFSIGSVIQLSNLMGPQIEYSTVIEKQENKGYIINQFSNYSDYPNLANSGTLGQSNSIFDPHTEMGYKRGLIKSKQYYNENNILLKDEFYTYSETNPKSARGLSYRYFMACSESNQQTQEYVITGNAYDIFYSDFNLTTKKTKIYGNAGQFFETVENSGFGDYENFGDNFLKSKSYIDTNGKTISENYTYSFDKNGTEPYTTLTNRREYPIIETSKLADQELLGKTKTDYALVSTVDVSGNPVTSQIFPQKFSESKGNNIIEEKLIVDRYDIDGHILKAHKYDGNYIYYYYGYDNKYPIIKIEGAEITNESIVQNDLGSLKLLLNIAAPDYNQIAQKQSSIIKSLPSYLCTFYTFKSQFGVSSIMNSSGMLEYYDYDSSGRLINVKDQNGKLLKSYSYELKNQ
jgi:hypothetical protein